MSNSPLSRVAIVGMGAVGASVAYVLINAGHAQEIILSDADLRRAEGQAMDLQHCLPWGRPLRMRVLPAKEIEGCGLVIVAAGAAQNPGETRLDLLKRNAAIIADIMGNTVARNPAAIYAIITNPVDVMARLALKISGLPPHRVFSTGTVLDSARFRFQLGQALEVDPRNVHAYVIGEHGDSEVPVWSRVTIGPYTLEEFAKLRGLDVGIPWRERISKDVRTAAYQIIERKGATSYAIGVSTLRIVESIADDQRTLQTVSRPLAGAYGLQEVCMSLPCLVAADGIAPPTELPLDASERAALLRSAEVLESAWAKLA